MDQSSEQYFCMHALALPYIEERCANLDLVNLSIVDIEVFPGGSQLACKFMTQVLNNTGCPI